MRNDILQLLFALLTLIFGAGCEDLLPSFCGVGFPILLVAVQYFAVRASMPVALLFAIAAGAAEDALSGLAPMTSVSYFLLVSVLSRRLDLPFALTALSAPCYQLWLAIWTSGLNVFTRILLAFPIGLATALVVVWTLETVSRKAALDERG